MKKGPDAPRFLLKTGSYWKIAYNLLQFMVNISYFMNTLADHLSPALTPTTRLVATSMDRDLRI